MLVNEGGMDILHSLVSNQQLHPDVFAVTKTVLDVVAQNRPMSWLVRVLYQAAVNRYAYFFTPFEIYTLETILNVVAQNIPVSRSMKARSIKHPLTGFKLDVSIWNLYTPLWNI